MELLNVKMTILNGGNVMKEKILRVLDKQIDGFICPNQADFKDDEIHEFFWAIDSLIEDGILRRRNCDGLAYEYNR